MVCHLDGAVFDSRLLFVAYLVVRVAFAWKNFSVSWGCST